jgi:hypothetical protein
MRAIRLVMTAAFLVGTTAISNAQELTDGSVTKSILESIHADEVNSLKGLSTLIVVVDRLDKTVVEAGLRGEDVRNDAEALLRSGKIPVGTADQWQAYQPFLKVKLVFDSSKAPYRGLVKVALTQTVILRSRLTQGKKVAPNNAKDTLWDARLDARDLRQAETWHTQRTFDADDIRGIRDAAKDLVNQFVHDYGIANPPKP